MYDVMILKNCLDDMRDQVAFVAGCLDDGKYKTMVGAIYELERARKATKENIKSIFKEKIIDIRCRHMKNLLDLEMSFNAAILADAKAKLAEIRSYEKRFEKTEKEDNKIKWGKVLPFKDNVIQLPEKDAKSDEMSDFIGFLNKMNATRAEDAKKLIERKKATPAPSA